MRHFLSALAAIVVLAGAGVAQAATPYVDKVNGFQLTPPEGWTTDLSENDDELKLQVFSADQQVACNMMVVKVPGLASLAQPELDAAFRRGDADGGVKFELSKLDMKLSDFEQSMIERDGHPAIYARFALEGDGLKLRMRKLVMASPGRVYNFNCGVVAPEEGSYRPDLDALIASIHLIYQ